MNQSIARPTEPEVGSGTSPYVRNFDWPCLLSAAVMLAATPIFWLSGTTRSDIASWGTGRPRLPDVNRSTRQPTPGGTQHHSALDHQQDQDGQRNQEIHADVSRTGLMEQGSVCTPRGSKSHAAADRGLNVPRFQGLAPCFAACRLGFRTETERRRAAADRVWCGPAAVRTAIPCVR